MSLRREKGKRRWADIGGGAIDGLCLSHPCVQHTDASVYYKIAPHADFRSISSTGRDAAGIYFFPQPFSCQVCQRWCSRSHGAQETEAAGSSNSQGCEIGQELHHSPRWPHLSSARQNQSFVQSQTTWATRGHPIAEEQTLYKLMT